MLRVIGMKGMSWMVRFDSMWRFGTVLGTMRIFIVVSDTCLHQEGQHDYHSNRALSHFLAYWSLAM